jgi:hypothetical protein
MELVHETVVIAADTETGKSLCDATVIVEDGDDSIWVDIGSGGLETSLFVSADGAEAFANVLIRAARALRGRA